jgi:hypothetical protein
MKPPKDLKEAREMGLEVDLEEGEMEAESRDDATTSKNKVIWPNTGLTQDNHGAHTVGIIGT